MDNHANKRRAKQQAKAPLTAPKDLPQQISALYQDSEDEEIQVNQHATEASSSVLLQGYRALGHYTSHIPFCLVKSDEDTLLATAVGDQAFYVYDTARLSLVYLSNWQIGAAQNQDGVLVPEKITWIEASPDGFVYTALAAGNSARIVCWKKMHKVLEFNGHTRPIVQFVVGGDYLFSLAEGGEFIIFNRKTGKIHKQFEFSANFQVMLHPTTYVNKFLFAGTTDEGKATIQLWNVMAEEKLFEFEDLTKDLPSEATVTCLQQSPMIDIVAVGFSTGQIAMANILYNETLLSFQHTTGPVKCLSFLSDQSLGVSLLASITDSGIDGGRITLWDLNEKKIHAVIQSAHSGKQVSHISFLPNEPVLVSSSHEGNSLKMWHLEKGVSVPRLLKQRAGHIENPIKIRFYGGWDDPVMQGARNLLSCSADGALRNINLLNDFASVDFSKKHLAKGRLRNENGSTALGAISGFGFSEFRESDWQNVLTCHREAQQPFLWTYANHSISKVSVSQPDSHRLSRVTAVSVSLCGNFGVLGYEDGSIQKFNLQSGKDRGLFKPAEGASQGEISGLGIDSLNHYLVSSARDGSVKLWDFLAQKEVKSLQSEFPVETLCYNRRNDIVAVATSALEVQLLNVKNDLKRVRVFENVATNRVTDLCFSQPDGKWLFVASLDKSIRIFDILTGSLIDWVQFQQAPLSLDFSPSGEYLATSHVGSKAIYLWSNKAYFSNVTIQKVATAPAKIDLPVLSSDLAQNSDVKKSHKDFYKAGESKQEDEADQGDISNLIQQKFEEVKSHEEAIGKEKQQKQLMTTSDQPYSKWQAIFNLEEIKERNKPQLAKQELPKSPFFLFDLETAITGRRADLKAADLFKDQFFTDSKAEEHKLKKHGFEQKLAKMLDSGAKARAIFDYLKTLSPSGVEFEFMSLGTAVEFTQAADFDINGGLRKMLKVFVAAVNLNRDTDFIQACLNNFLKVHSEALMEDAELCEILQSEVMPASEQSLARVEDLLSSNLCMAEYFSGINTF